MTAAIVGLGLRVITTVDDGISTAAGAINTDLQAASNAATITP